MLSITPSYLYSYTVKYSKLCMYSILLDISSSEFNLVNDGTYIQTSVLPKNMVGLFAYGMQFLTRIILSVYFIYTQSITPQNFWLGSKCNICFLDSVTNKHYMNIRCVLFLWIIKSSIKYLNVCFIVQLERNIDNSIHYVSDKSLT